MIPQNFEYSAPTQLAEALQLLAGGAKPLAGGMSLIPVMKLRLAAPEHLVDLGRIPSLSGIRQDGNVVRIGAMTTHYEVESSPLLRTAAPLLQETVKHIGDVQVRNMGTIGGSVAHADPAADYPAALLSLEARIRIASASGEREIPAGDFFVDTFTTALEPGEIITEIVVPVEEQGTGAAYQKMVQPASGFAIVGVAVRLQRAAGKVTMARIGATGLAAKAFRAMGAERLLEGTDASPESIRKSAAAVAEGVEANSDLHASAEYRKHLAGVYAARAISLALSRTA